MKRVVISAKTVSYPENIRLEDIVKYLEGIKAEDSNVTHDEIKVMAREIGQCLKKEEMEYGEPYESIYDADIEELCDASTTDLHDMYYNLIGLNDEE